MTDNGAQIGLVFDCADPDALAEFWAPALGYVNLGTAGAYVALFPDGRSGPRRMAFTTIHIADDLDARKHRRAVRTGPWQVATRRPYPELVAQAGFHDVVAIDVTTGYASTQRAWLEANESRAADVRRLVSDKEFETAQADRRYAQAAIDEGLLRRSLITATRG